MASKLNTRFILIFSIILAVGVGFGGFVWWWQRSTAAERNFAAAQRFEAEGDYRKAVNYYGRSVNREPTNVKYLEALDAALRKQVPDTIDQAREAYNQLIGVRFQRARARPNEAAGWLAAMETLYQRNNAFNSETLWREFGSEAEQIAGRLAPDDPAQNRLKYWQAIGSARRGGALTDAERADAERMLREVLAQDASMDEAWLDLIRSQLDAAIKYRSENRVSDARRKFAEVDATIDEARQAAPAGLSWRLGRLQRLQDQLAQREQGVTQQDVDNARAEVATLEDRVAGDREKTFAVALALLDGRNRQWLEKAAKLMSDRVEADPTDMVARRVLMLAGSDTDRAKALAVAQETLAMPNLPTSLESLVQEDARQVAVNTLFNTAFLDLLSSQDAAERATRLEALRSARDQAIQYLEPRGERLAVQLIEAKTAVAENRPGDAVAAFDEVLRLQDQPGPDTYLFAAMANLGRRETGTAMRICTDGLKSYPGFTPLLLMRAEIEAATGRTEEARATVLQVLATDPANDRAARLQKALEGTAVNVGEMAMANRDDAVAQVVSQAERLMIERDLAGAQQALSAALAQNPDDVRLYVALAQLTGIVMENADEGNRWIAEGLKRSPGNPTLLQFQALLSSRDPLERVLKSVELQYPDPDNRAVFGYINMVDLRVRLRQLAANAQAPAADRAQAEDALRRMDQMLPGMLDQALTVGAREEILLEAAAREAIERKDWTAVERVAAAGEQAGERGVAATLRSRALMAQEKPQEAMEVLVAARRAGDMSPLLLRQMALMHERDGDLAAAIESMGQAYERKPNDLVTARLYALLLNRAGERSQALQVLRNLARANPANREILEGWLDLEADIGDRAGAMAMRRRVYKDSPAYRENAMALASMLLSAPGEPMFMQDAEGKPLFKPEELRAMNPALRQRIEDAQKANVDLGLQILDTLQKQDPTDPTVAIMRGRALSEQRSPQDGEASLAAAIANAPPAQKRALLMGLGAIMFENGRPEQAEVQFGEAAKLQDPQAREVDVEIADFWFQQRQWQRARERLEPVVKAASGGSDDQRVYALAGRLAEICQNLRDYDAATAYVDLAEKRLGKPDVTLQLLRASIAQGLSQAAMARGDTEAMKGRLRDAIAAFEKAAALQPNNVMSWTALANAQRTLYLQSREPADLQNAIASADKAVGMASTYLPAARLKTDLLLDSGDLAGATQHMERFVTVMPQASDARRQLIDLYMRADNSARALAAAEVGATLEPRNAVWPATVGNVQLAANRLDEAIRAFDRAFLTDQSENNLIRSVNVRLRKDKPDWNEVVAMIRANPEIAKDSAALQALLAASLVNAGQREAGLQALRNLYTQIRTGVDRGAARPEIWDTWYAAIVETFRNQPAEADAFVKTMMAGTTPDFFANRGLARIWRAAGPDNLGKSLEYFDAAIRAAGENRGMQVQGFMESGETAYAVGKCDLAVPRFEKALEILPDDPPALNNAAFVAAKCGGAPDKAEAWARKAVERAPGSPEFLDTLGYVLVRVGKPQEALAPLQRSATMAPAPSTLLHLADALRAAGRMDEARSTLAKTRTMKLSDDLKAERDEIEKALQ